MDNQEQLNRDLREAAYTGNLALLKQLIEAKADVDTPGKNNVTALMQAARLGNFSCVQALIEAKAWLQMRNFNFINSPNGETALMLASKSNNLNAQSICEIFVEASLRIANIQQKKAITTWLGLNKFRNTLGFLGLVPNFSQTFKPHLCAAIHDQNKRDFGNSFAYGTIDELKDGPIKEHLLEKYLKKSDAQLKTKQIKAGESHEKIN
jgi:ankyrin repeat protein